MSFHPHTPQSPSRQSPGTSADIVTAGSTTNPLTAAPAALPTPAHSVSGSASQTDIAMADESPQKRKRAPDDIGDRAHKKANLGLAPEIQDLHLDVGEKYLLCQTPHPEAFPSTSGDLYAQFGLTGIAAEVAREKPNGEKNALRKTYKGHIKRLGVAGHFDVQKKEPNAMSDLMAMVQMPELEWHVHHVKGREINDGLSQDTLSSLGRAFTMAKGPISRSVWDFTVLGELTGSGDLKPSSARPSAPGTPVPAAPGSAHLATSKLKQQQLPPGHDPLRPKRNIKKRGYGDSSFEGYGEGFPDDDGAVGSGYDTGDGEGGQKRRKKTPGNSPTYGTPGAVRQPSYGPGMVGA